MDPNINVDIRFEDPPARFFSPLNPDIDASATVTFGSDTDQIIEIRMGLNGTIHSVYHDVILKTTLINGTPMAYPEPNDLQEAHTLFDHTNQGRDCVGEDFHKGDVMTTRAQLGFPSDSVYLPSSTDWIGSRHTKCGAISIVYSLYVTVNYTSREIGGHSSKTYGIKVPFQAQMMLYSGGHKEPIKEYSLRKTFPSKLKSFYYDENIKGLVPSSLKSPHTRTRGIRALFSDKYKKAVWEKEQQDVLMGCTFGVSSLCNLMHTLEEPLSIKFQVSADSLEPDFCFEGQSTGLGKFDILELGIYSDYSVNMLTQGHPYTFTGSQKIVSISIPSGSAQIDVKDFKQTDKRLYELQLPEKFLASLCPSPLIKSMEFPCIMSGAANKFESSSSLRITLVLGSSIKKEKIDQVYEMATDGMFYID